jgi:uncharacterized protein
MRRVLKKLIIQDLGKKMVFLVGPRQVGKTWLAKNIQKEDFENKGKKALLLNYDNTDHREIFHKANWLDDIELLIFDEIHKMKGWKNHLKGIYDTKADHQKILVTGSARLDTFQQTGESLAGRFFKHRLMPFTLSELKIIGQEKISLEKLMQRGGFPEPFLAKKPVDAERWRQQYIDGLIRDDILDFENIHDFKSLKLVFELLKRRVGSPVSFRSIAEDVGIAPNTVIKYIQVLESLFIVFKVTPFSKNIARSILKEPKIYFYDTGLVVGDEGVELENFIAMSLLKHAYAQNDQLGQSWELQYLRTKEKREVDFCLVKDDIIHSLIEVKKSDASIHKHLSYFSEKYDLPGFQVVQNLKTERKENKIAIIKAENYLKRLFL